MQGDFSSRDYDEPKSQEDKPAEVFTFACNYGMEDEWLFHSIMSEVQIAFLEYMDHDWDLYPEVPASIFVNYDEREAEYQKFIKAHPEGTA